MPQTVFEPPVDTADVDKKLRKMFMVNGFLLSLTLVVIPIILIVGQQYLAHKFPYAFGYTTHGRHRAHVPLQFYPSGGDVTAVFTSPGSVMLDIVSAGAIMVVFWRGIAKINAMMLSYARSFVERKQWMDAVNILSSFDQQGQHFLDGSGEAHALLVQAYRMTGKPQASEKARKFVLKFRPKSEWAAKFRQEDEATASSKPSNRQTVVISDAKPRPAVAKSKKRRF